jgi:trigger factor
MALEIRTEIKELSSVERELSIVVPGDAVAKELDKAYRKLGQRVRIKGFRPGRVPRYVLEQYYKDQTEADVMERLVGDSYREAIGAHSLQPVAQPNIEGHPELIAGMDFSYSARVEVKPEIELKKYEGLALTKRVYSVGDEDVERELNNLRERMVKVVPVEDRDIIEQGDLVECNYSGTVDGEHVRGLAGVSYVIEVGGGAFYPEAEQALVGKKLGEQFDVDVTLPEDFRVEAHRGKTATLSIKPEEIKTRNLPALDDEFAKDVSDEFETLDALKKSLLEGLEKQAKSRSENELRDAAVDLLIEENPFDVPAALIDRQAEQLAADTLGRLPREAAERIWQAQGSRLKEDARPKALRQVRAGLLLETLSSTLDINIEDADVDAHLEKLAEAANQPVKTLKNLYRSGQRREQLTQQLALEKALDAVLEKSQVAEESASLVEKSAE